MREFNQETHMSENPVKSENPGADLERSLLAAVEASDASAVADLLARGANPLTGLRDNASALQRAASNGDVECLMLMAALPRAEVGLDSAINDAAWGGHAGCIESLIPLVESRLPTNYGLINAACNGHSECVRLLLSLKYDNSSIQQAAEFSASRGDAVSISFLLPRLLVDKIDSSAALQLGASAGHVDCLRLLLSLPALPLDSYSKALFSAAKKGHDGCAELLAPLASHGGASHALFVAAANGHRECVKLLALIGKPMHNNSSALLAACENGHADCAAILLPASNLAAKDHYALRWAARNGHAKVLALILGHPDSGADSCDLKKLLRQARLDKRDEAADVLNSFIEAREMAQETPSAPDAFPRQRL